MRQTEISSKSISGGVIVELPHMCSFSYERLPLICARFPDVEGITGFTCDLRSESHENCFAEDVFSTLSKIRAGLSANQTLLARVGGPSKYSQDQSRRLKSAGVNLLIVEPFDNGSVWDASELLRRLRIPCLLEIDHKRVQVQVAIHSLAKLAMENEEILGVVLRNQLDVTKYDEDYLAIKQISRPIAALSATDQTMFHNLNTGADGLISSLALIAPWEVTELYRCSVEGRFYDAQAIYNRLLPLISLLKSRSSEEQHMLLRRAAQLRGLIAEGDQNPPTSDELSQILRQVLDHIRLKPIT